MSQYILEMKEISKTFAVPVLKGVDFSLKKGEVHALVGGNGAGKSTLMKIMTGVYSMDGGEVWVDGKKTEVRSTHDAKENGIAMIFQELSLVPTMTVAENIFLGEELTKGGMRRTGDMNERAEAVLKRLGINVGAKERIDSLSVGLCQMIEIAKAVAKDARILVLDEPTASLSDSETKQLFKMIRDLQAKGVSMVYISHRMSEILEITDSITILRDGGIVFTGSTKEITLDVIIKHMLGEDKNNKKFAWVERKANEKREDILTVEHLKINDRIADISFSLKEGEILGLAGLMGSGRTEILETLFGIRKKQSGTVRLRGTQVEVKNPRQAVKAGFALIPEDRRRQGLVLIHSVKENAILPKIQKIVKGKIIIDEKSANTIVEDNVSSLGVVTDNIHKRINLLSGGNQQKIVIAKWLNMHPEIIMLDEPTAGVDIGAKAEIIDLMRNFADGGKGVLFVSSELAELMAVCDRILVLFDGKVTGELWRKDIKTEEELQYAIQKK
jgi:ribose transport system ATP-binding protein